MGVGMVVCMQVGRGRRAGRKRRKRCGFENGHVVWRLFVKKAETKQDMQNMQALS
jgi:hypothetical protein